MRRMHAIIPPTLGHLRDYNHVTHLRVFCLAVDCHHGDLKVPLAPLIARFGTACPVPALDRRFRCSRCGGNDVSIQLDWPVQPPLGTRM